MILEKGWVFYFEIQQICGQVNREEYEVEPPTRINTQNTEKENTVDHQDQKINVNTGRLNKLRIN